MSKKYIKLSEEEKISLRSAHKHHSCYQVRERCQCLILSSEGKQVKELAQIFSVIPLTIYNWFYRWEAKGIAGLFNQQGQGRKPILTIGESGLIKEKVQAHAQQLKQAREELKRELGKEFSQKTLKRFLKTLVQDGNAGAKASSQNRI